MTSHTQFTVLDPLNARSPAVRALLSPIGTLTWFKIAPVSLKNYPETTARAEAAFEFAKKKYTNRFMRLAKIALFKAQYNGSRKYFEKNRRTIAVCWNGLNGTRRVFANAALDAGARTLYFELCPFAGRITVDPCGVNAANSLPRNIEPYLKWAKSAKTNDLKAFSDTIQARKPVANKVRGAAERSLLEPFIFAPLQVPGDSQLRIFGGNFKTVEATIEGLSAAARSLPDGWHLRIKEHPSSPTSFHELFGRLAHPKIILDNETDTFAQVAASRAVVTVNSSVGLEAMFFEKPVIALGDCFWALPGVADHCKDIAALTDRFAMPEDLSFDHAARNAFLSYLIEVYYPKLPEHGESMLPEEIEKIVMRLNGPDQFGFWSNQR